MNDEKKNNDSEAKIISIDEARIREHLDGVVREAVEETLNKLLDAEVMFPPNIPHSNQLSSQLT
jgi:hypothetical protein